MVDIMTQIGIATQEAADKLWDVLVIGSGPAGAIAAARTASLGYQTLLVDKQSFPRSKVCGACLNARSIEVLDILGYGPTFSDIPSIETHTLELHCGSRSAHLPLPSGKAIARSVLDNALARAAVRAGARWLPGTTAAVGEVSTDGMSRDVELKRADAERAQTARARVVLAADGLASPSLQRRRHEFASRILPNSRIGLGGVLQAPSDWPDGVIRMAVSRLGYVGSVRLADGSLNVAAALDAAHLKRGDAGEAIASICNAAGLPDLDLQNVPWRGTPRLTRRMIAPASTRVLVIGDAAAYVEPFTGEGIAWAVTSGAAAAILIRHGVHQWTKETEIRWLNLYRRLLEKHRGPCRLAARILRHYPLAALVTQLLSWFPSIAAPLVSRSSLLPRDIAEFVRACVCERRGRPSGPPHDDLATWSFAGSCHP